MIPSPTPTAHQFQAFEKAYDYFNQVLFEGELPGVILNLSRKSKAMGFVAPFRWRRAEQKPGEKGTVHELSINPEILCLGLIDVYSTLVHEQCHIWQFTFGTPSRSGYHNKEWAAKMEAIGLIPSSTGKPGGKKTGQNMSDYPAEGGKFTKALETMPEDYKLPFVSIEGDRAMLLMGQTSMDEEGMSGRPEGGHIPRPSSRKRNKTKYQCECGTNIWGKPDLNIHCGDCKEPFEVIVA